MVFLRKKIIKGRAYYYLVKSVREGDKVKQKCIRYLGKPEDFIKEELLDSAKKDR